LTIAQSGDALSPRGGEALMGPATRPSRPLVNIVFHTVLRGSAKHVARRGTTIASMRIAAPRLYAAIV